MEVLLGFAGFVLLITPLILAIVNRSRVESLTRRILELERASLNHAGSIEELRKRSSPVTPGTQSVSPPPSKPVTFEETIAKPGPMVHEGVKPMPRAPAEEMKAPPQPETLEAKPLFAAGPAPPQFVPSRSFASEPKSRTNKEWEALIGGKILNRIGALALIIGMGFFLKYAFDNNWISETVRVLLGGLAGAALLFGAARIHKKGFEVFSQGIVGAGIAILYLSVYAAFNFYRLVPQVVAFVLMSGVTMVTLWQALKYDSLAVALLGWAGGFLTPFMLSTGEVNEVGFFTYIALLDAGLMAIVLSKEKWIILEPLTVGATYLIYYVWFDGGMYKPEALATTIFFLTLFWVLFFGYEAVRNMRNIGGPFMVRQAVAIANVVLYFAGMYELIEPGHHAWMGLVTLIVGVPYFTMFYVLRQKGEPNQALLARYLLAAVTLLFSATAIHFSAFTTVVLWSVEALVVVYAGSRWNMKALWIAALVMFGFAFMKLLFSDGSLSFVPLEQFRILFNGRALAYLTLGATMLASTELFRMRPEKLAAGFNVALGYGWSLVILILLFVETADLFSRWMLNVEGAAYHYLSFKRDLTIGMVWMAYSVGLTLFGFHRHSRPVLYSGIVVLILALGMGGLRSIAFEPIEQYSFIFNYRVLAVVFLVAGTIVHVRMWGKHGEGVKNSGGFVSAVSVATILLLFSLMTSETYEGFGSLLRNATGDVTDLLSFKRVLTLALVWSAYSLGLTWFGLAKKHKPAMYCGLGIMGLGLFVGLIRSLWYEPVDWFYPVLNYRFLILCLLVAVAVTQARLWRGKGTEIDWTKTLTGAIGLVIVALILVLLTSETRDFFEKKILTLQGIMADNWTRNLEAQMEDLKNMQQLSLSGVWLFSSIVLMVVGIWRRRRNFRLVAIGLFGITILKIFIYDLSFLQTLYRIFSFMGLGVILLCVSYLYQKYKMIILEGEEEMKPEPLASKEDPVSV